MESGEYVVEEEVKDDGEVDIEGEGVHRISSALSDTEGGKKGAGRDGGGDGGGGEEEDDDDDEIDDDGFVITPPLSAQKQEDVVAQSGEVAGDDGKEGWGGEGGETRWETKKGRKTKQIEKTAAHDKEHLSGESSSVRFSENPSVYARDEYPSHPLLHGKSVGSEEDHLDREIRTCIGLTKCVGYSCCALLFFFHFIAMVVDWSCSCDGKAWILVFFLATMLIEGYLLFVWSQWCCACWKKKKDGERVYSFPEDSLHPHVPLALRDEESHSPTLHDSHEPLSGSASVKETQGQKNWQQFRSQFFSLWLHESALRTRPKTKIAILVLVHVFFLYGVFVVFHFNGCSKSCSFLYEVSMLEVVVLCVLLAVEVYTLFYALEEKYHFLPRNCGMYGKDDRL
eukprot:TRINITY_DN576_c0_g2_i1.p1 TRINITY_DN576_c0_g2~~TRINITY_DN576_c0_g2_i1.p1  ORF type:complete len:397 (+),score=144.81 TRINITY_DN576_c0_g2_i1:88-1278(+)